MVHLAYPDLLSVGQRVLGGEKPVRDAGLLESALARPRASALGTDAYPTLAEKAAALTHSFVRHHGLIDSNKRLGLAALIAFLGVNGRRLTCSNDDAYAFTINIASGHPNDVSDIAHQIMLGSKARQADQHDP